MESPSYTSYFKIKEQDLTEKKSLSELADKFKKQFDCSDIKENYDYTLGLIEELQKRSLLVDS